MNTLFGKPEKLTYEGIKVQGITIGASIEHDRGLIAIQTGRGKRFLLTVESVRWMAEHLIKIADFAEASKEDGR